MEADPEQPEPTNEIRPEVRDLSQEKTSISGKTELEVEFERAEVDRDIEIGESAEITEKVQEVFEQTAVAAVVTSSQLQSPNKLLVRLTRPCR